MSRNAPVIGGVIACVCLLLTAFLVFDIKIANESKRIMAYNNPRPNIPALRAAVARQPNDAAAWMNLGRYDYFHHNYGAAVPELQQVTRLEPESSDYNSEALFWLANAQLRTGHDDQARATYQHLATYPDVYGSKAREYMSREGGR